MSSKHLLPREDVRTSLGRMIVCGFATTSVTAEVKEILKEVQPLGVILFARNIESPDQVAELNRELKSLRPQEPLLVCVDQEGGRVARVRRPATEWPDMATLGVTRDTELAKAFGLSLGRELRAMGFDINCAPVLDVNTNPDNPVIGDRAFSDHPETVAAMGIAVQRGLREAGVVPCGKHFPGHGDTDKDSHKALPKVSHDLDRLRDVEWLPFRAAIGAGIPAIMSAHVLVECLDEEHPATVSPEVLGRLREELGFKGIVFSDDVEMKALADRYEPEEIGRLGVKAGIDVFLCCERYEVTQGVYRGLVRAAEQGGISHESIIARNKRIATLLRGNPTHGARARAAALPPPTVRDAAGIMRDMQRYVGCGEHLELAQKIRLAAEDARARLS